MAVKKKRRGAPKKDNPAIERVHVRCTPDQLRKWRIAANKAGLSLSAWLKLVADINA